MTEKSGLAAVAAAAAGTAAATKPDPLTAERVKAEAPSVYAAIFEAGAIAEQQRILDIEKASMPGHANLISAFKADRSKTSADAALAVIAAENAARAHQLAGLDADEDKAKGLKAVAAPASEQAAKDPRVMADKAKAYQAEMKAKGITVTTAQAVAHVEKEG